MQKSVDNRQINSEFLSHKKIAIVVSLFNKDVCQGLVDGALRTLREAGFDEKRYRIFQVPGAFEIPLVTKKIAQSGLFDGVVTLGCVIRGDTPHFEFVSLATTIGILQTGLDTGCPVSFGVITVNDEKQAFARSAADELNKGREATLALFDTLQTLSQIGEKL